MKSNEITQLAIPVRCYSWGRISVSLTNHIQTVLWETRSYCTAQFHRLAPGYVAILNSRPRPRIFSISRLTLHRQNQSMEKRWCGSFSFQPYIHLPMLQDFSPRHRYRDKQLSTTTSKRARIKKKKERGGQISGNWSPNAHFADE